MAYGPTKYWYYYDTWVWTAGTWGTGSWSLYEKAGPLYDDPWTAHGQTQLMDSNVRVYAPWKAQVLSRRYRWDGLKWIREV